MTSSTTILLYTYICKTVITGIWFRHFYLKMKYFAKSIRRLTIQLFVSETFIYYTNLCVLKHTFLFVLSGAKIAKTWGGYLTFKQEAPQCEETRFSTIQPSINVTGIRNERWQWRNNDVVILVALVACTKFGVNRPKQTKVIERKLNFYF